MSGYRTLPRPVGWPCACPVNVRSYFGKSALECMCCGLRITGEEGGVDLPKETVIGTWCECGKPSGESGVCAECREKDAFDAEAARKFFRGM